MKLEVYGDDTPENKIVRLRLNQSGSGVTLVAVDEHGEPLNNGDLLEVRSAGDIIMHGGVNKDLGFRLHKSNNEIEVL